MTTADNSKVTEDRDTDPPREYLDAIKAAVIKLTNPIADRLGEPRWTDEEAQAYADCGGWGGYYADGYPAEDAVSEDMTYWSD